MGDVAAMVPLPGSNPRNPKELHITLPVSSMARYVCSGSHAPCTALTQTRAFGRVEAPRHPAAAFACAARGCKTVSW